jgi:hypothetical protein
MIFGNIKDYESGFAWLPQPLKTVIKHLKQTDSSGRDNMNAQQNI